MDFRTTSLILSSLAGGLALVAVFSPDQQLLAQDTEPAPIFRTKDPIPPSAPPEPGTPAGQPLQPGLPSEEPAPPAAPPGPPPKPELPLGVPRPSVPVYPGLYDTDPKPKPEAERVPIEAQPPSTGASIPPEEAPALLPPLPRIAPPPEQPEAPKTTGPGFEATWQTVKGARILTLSIPAPRGQIVDRYGAPLAQNTVAYYLGVNIPYMENSSDDEIVAFATTRIDQANEIMGSAWKLSDDEIIAHYKDRRWLPLIFSGWPLTDSQHAKITAADIQGLIIHPTYQRVYPRGRSAGHIIGFVGKRGPWPKGEIPDGEMMWPTAEGIRGLELWYDEYLTGQPGRVQIIFDDKGNRVQETVIRSPVPGHNIITTLDIDMQVMAEKHLEDGAKRGAFVIMDVRTGDVLAMASFPMFDPNDYIPRITVEKYRALVDDPDKPLRGRAYQDRYPPASTFKVAAALAMLEAGSVNELSLYSCPTSFWIGDRDFHNWNKEPEGSMNVIGALTRSCNTWFYQAAIDTGAAHITMMGQKLGFGRKTGIPLPEEIPGLMPTNEWFRETFGYAILDGDLANMSIGQGNVEATPLQVCQMMAAIGNRQFLTDARLVLQVQDFGNGIIEAYDVSRRALNISQHSLTVVHEGMRSVVNAGNGTAGRARHDRISMSGKTGTGQWRPAKDQNVAWLAGFAPSEFPVYAYAALYEGDPGETVSGGRAAAPIVGGYFKEFLNDEKLAQLQEASDDIRIELAEIVDVAPLEAGSIFKDDVAGDIFVDEPPPEHAARNKGRGFFSRIFGGRD